jgi:hypothetical protein
VDDHTDRMRFRKRCRRERTVTWEFSGSLQGDLTVSGPGTAGGTLHVEGAWEQPGPVGKFKVSGTPRRQAGGCARAGGVNHEESRDDYESDAVKYRAFDYFTGPK